MVDVTSVRGISLTDGKLEDMVGEKKDLNRSHELFGLKETTCMGTGNPT